MLHMKRIWLLPIVVGMIVLFVLIYHQKNPSYQQSLYLKTTNADSPAISSVAPNIKISVGKIPDFPINLPSGFAIHVFAVGLGTARDLQFSPGGTLLVSDPDAGNVYALPDKNNDGVADSVKTIIVGENRPHGLAFYQGKLFVAEVDKVVRYSWSEATLTATKEKVLFSLPDNIDHNNRTIVFDKTGRMFVSVGSTCNVCNESANLSGTIVVSDSNGSNPTVFAKGQRNAPFIQINPATGDLWATGMGRDYLGDNLPPDEINIIRQGGDYGWPNCYGNKIPDFTFNPGANCSNTIAPVYEVPAHNAPLGLVFINSVQFPKDWQGDLLVAYHGSWNSSIPVGYKVVHLKVNGNAITNSDDFMTGFLPAGALIGSNSWGRPVDLTFDSKGNLFISDDKTGNIYIVQKM